MSDAAEKLCKSCGACCTGLLFDEFNTAGAGPAVADQVKLPDGSLPRAVPQPCRFHNGTCQVYADRPNVCRKFRCRVLRKVESGEQSLAWAEAKIAAFKTHQANLADMLPPGPGDMRTRMKRFLNEARQDGPAADFNRDNPQVAQAIMMSFHLRDEFYRAGDRDGMAADGGE